MSIIRHTNITAIFLMFFLFCNALFFRDTIPIYAQFKVQSKRHSYRLCDAIET
jgi:hypothetical protein